MRKRVTDQTGFRGQIHATKKANDTSRGPSKIVAGKPMTSSNVAVISPASIPTSSAHAIRSKCIHDRP